MGLPLSARAGRVPTTTVAAESAKERIVSLIERSDVRAQLQSLGVNPNDGKARVAALSDAEAAQLAARFDSLPAGGDAGGALIGAPVLRFLLLVPTEILCFTPAFPFTKPIQ